MWNTAVVGARVMVPVNIRPSDPWFWWENGTVVATPRGPRMLVRVDSGRRVKALKISSRPVIKRDDNGAALTANEWMWKTPEQNTPMRCFMEAMRLAKQ